MSRAARANTVDVVYERVRNAILGGEIAPGSTITREALATELDVSRTPLREALRVLQGEGLIEAKMNRLVTVQPMSAADCEELAVMRIVLETQAIRLAVPRLAPENIGELEALLAEMTYFADVEDYDRWHVPHRAFHRGLTADAGERMNTALDRLFDHAERYRRLHTGLAPSRWATASHRAILNACRSGDGETSARLLAGHLARTALDIVELLEPGYRPSRLNEVQSEVDAKLPQ